MGAPDQPLPEPVEGHLDEPVRLVAVPVIGAPVPYRAYEAGGSRFGWTVPPIRYLVSRHFFPRYFAVTLRLRPNGDWTVAQLKGFEFEEEARRWAGGLWRDARRAPQG